MKKQPSKYRVYWIAAFGAVLVFCTYVGQTYYKLRSINDPLPLVGMLIMAELDWFSERLVEFELRRKIRNGDFLGADVLSSTLTVGVERGEYRDAAIRRAEWLMADLVDVNSEGMGGLPALHQAVAVNDVVMAELLIQLGADPRVRVLTHSGDENGMDAIEYAEMVGDMFPERDMTAMIRVLESATESR
ncbi:MAG: hypothetical protein QNI99_11730 [Woeseiaceae bacterium]|nr:hypothetical protein [Woeseiaceae bacterium]